MFLKNTDVKWVPVIEPYVVYQSEVQKSYKGHFIIESDSNEDFKGHDPNDNEVNYFDFTHKETKLYWCELLQNFHKELKFDGVWLNENEIENHGINSYTSDLPFLPVNTTLKSTIIPLSAQYSNKMTEFDFHTFYSLFQAQSTHECLIQQINQTLPFILSRATSES